MRLVHLFFPKSNRNRSLRERVSACVMSPMNREYRLVMPTLSVESGTPPRNNIETPTHNPAHTPGFVSKKPLNATPNPERELDADEKSGDFC